VAAFLAVAGFGGSSCFTSSLDFLYGAAAGFFASYAGLALAFGVALAAGAASLAAGLFFPANLSPPLPAAAAFAAYSASPAYLASFSLYAFISLSYLFFSRSDLAWCTCLSASVSVFHSSLIFYRRVFRYLTL
jgi:hypothetical protein